MPFTGWPRRLSGLRTCRGPRAGDIFEGAVRRESFHLEEFGIRPWAMRILHNLNMTLTRATRESRQPMAIEEEELDACRAMLQDFRKLRSLTKDEMDQELVWAIDSLPESYRAVLLLWAVEEKSYAEIAVALDLPPGTVISRLHRARKRICDQLGRTPLSPSHAS